MKNTEKAPNDYKLAVQKLKVTLKDRGMTYRELGKEIGLTESGVKKIFLAKRSLTEYSTKFVYH